MDMEKIDDDKPLTRAAKAIGGIAALLGAAWFVWMLGYDQGGEKQICWPFTKGVTPTDQCGENQHCQVCLHDPEKIKLLIEFYEKELGHARHL